MTDLAVAASSTWFVVSLMSLAAAVFLAGMVLLMKGSNR